MDEKQIQLLYSMIFQRKSIRKFADTRLTESEKETLERSISQLTPIFPDVKTTAEIVTSAGVSGIFGIRAPYYIVSGSQDAERGAINLGFMFQQLDLYLSSVGYGSCWVGMMKPVRSAVPEQPYQFVQAFGKPAETLYRSMDQFKRKSMEEIADGTDPRLEAVRLAPSGTNAQPWFFICDAGKIHVYRKDALSFGKIFIPGITNVDIGIALCHLMLATVQGGKPFHFERQDTAPAKVGFAYIGTVL